MIIGQYNYNLDPKKRLTIPPKFRSVLSKGAILTRGIDGCLFLYPQKQWNELAEKLSKLPLSQVNARSFARVMIAGAMDVKLDSLGRILIPDYLKDYAKLDKKVVIAGLYDRIEIWNEENWQKYGATTGTQVENIAEGLKELGI
ncbi:MAG TPA: division/cell wall cluster transcriptional repressor MraZ [Candidatus Pacearchaeota archaeon]|jgi:MraZ protein|nr:division/cell wall cluster transcriptional repressor MraZ [Parcubacteria group bacterium]HOF44928.1 division/cell wall cluster transcriptional repressor MraZ [Candidatus Pacearchaeota archaeon]HRT18249.1 division/cell wall cluster transcriptional repressor MraZ [Candidatus Paceibacterota bacterium]HOS12934.1 division/cell wall cluster transcriptional repressor MraZ [Candidatus Pacearchaeota archaeon]HPL72709.1 division/cell wall cluster transcriptional repressor MraZ [Candidatus Pacearchaeot